MQGRTHSDAQSMDSMESQTTDRRRCWNMQETDRQQVRGRFKYSVCKPKADAYLYMIQMCKHASCQKALVLQGKIKGMSAFAPT